MFSSWVGCGFWEVWLSLWSLGNCFGKVFFSRVFWLIRVVEVRSTLVGAENCFWICFVRGVGGLDREVERSRFFFSSRLEKLSWIMRSFSSFSRFAFIFRFKDGMFDVAVSAENIFIFRFDSFCIGTSFDGVSISMVFRYSREVIVCKVRFSFSVFSVVGRRFLFFFEEIKLSRISRACFCFIL